MKTISLNLDDELNSTLEMISSEQGRNKAEVVVDVVRKYLETEKSKRALQDPKLIELYQQLIEEDRELAEEGLEEYDNMLSEADRT